MKVTERRLFHALLKILKNPAKGARAKWWLGAMAFGGLLIFARSAVSYLTFVWCSFNFLYGASAFVWMLFHPRKLGQSTTTSVNLSRWLTSISGLAIYLNLASSNGQRMSPGVILTVVLAICPFIYGLFIVSGVFGASLGAFDRRNSNNLERSAVCGVAGFWVACGIVISILFLGITNFIFSRSFLILSIPVLTLGITRLIIRITVNKSETPVRIIDTALRKLVFQRQYRGALKTFDLRGIAIGLVIASIACAIGNGLTGPTQQSVLMSLFRMRSQIINQLQTDSTPDSGVIVSKMDATSRVTTFTTSSESALQASLIMRLKSLKAKLVILPMPTIDSANADTTSGSTAGPFDTNARETQHSIRDIPVLAEAIKENGNVILVASPDQKRSPVVAPLIASAFGVATYGVEQYGSMSVPAIPIKWTGDAPLPIVIEMVSHPPKVTDLRNPKEFERAVRTAASTLPQAIPGYAVIDFRISSAADVIRSTIVSIPGQSILKETSANLSLISGKPTLVPIETVIKNKIVILEPLVQHDVDTPMGLMTQYEMLGRATATLLHGSAIGVASRWSRITWTLVLGILIGTLCVGRDPFKASWRVGVLMLITISYSMFDYVVLGVWADPVVPLFMGATAYLLITQFTFGLERDERERNRALFSRFVAKEFVDEMLQSTSMKVALGGEKRTVCVLFADVRNFTGFAESHRPEEVIEIMNIYLTALTNALDLYGGLLDKYTGDGLMAFFEIKGEAREDLVRAVSATLAMRDAAVEVSDKLAMEGRKTLEIGIGMHYGEAIVGLVGNAERQINYTALGHTVVVSARLQTLAEGGEIVISEPIYKLVCDQFASVAMPPVFVKGISTEMRPYKVSRLGTVEKSA